MDTIQDDPSDPAVHGAARKCLVGQKVHGVLGSIVAILGICLPGGALMYGVGLFYRLHRDHVWATAALKGVTPAAVGLILRRP